MRSIAFVTGGCGMEIKPDLCHRMLGVEVIRVRVFYQGFQTQEN